MVLTWFYLTDQNDDLFLYQDFPGKIQKYERFGIESGIARMNKPG
jgi:hypothetical protein